MDGLLINLKFSINAIENNKYDPTLTLAFKLARLFDTTVDELFS